MSDLGKSGCQDVYISENGRESEIQDLNSAHLANILRKLERKAKAAFERGDKLEGGLDARSWRQFLPVTYMDLEDEAIYRGIDWSVRETNTSEERPGQTS